MNNSKIKLYKKPALQPMRPYVQDEDMTGISVSGQDTPEVGGMIAINPQNEKDQWYVAKQFFEDNYVEDVKDLNTESASCGHYRPSLEEQKMNLLSMFIHNDNPFVFDEDKLNKIIKWIESDQQLDFFERLKVEQTELREKYVKLTAFLATDLFNSLLTPEQDILREQSVYMLKYVTILDQRVSNSF